MNGYIGHFENGPESGTRAVGRGSIPMRRRRSLPLPAFVAPQLATLVDRVPEGRAWLHEVKFDGYRIEIAIGGRQVRIITRGGHDWTAKFPAIARAAAALEVRAALIDGEAIVQEETGRSDISALQAMLGSGDLNAIVCFAFDLLHLGGEDLKDIPLRSRKALLAALLGRQPPTSALQLSEHIEGGGPAFYKVACAHRLAGIVSKRANSLYRSGRNGAWLKVKCTLRQEFVVGGWLPRADEPNGVGALLVGYFDKGAFKYAGKIGTGFDRKMRAELAKRLGVRTRAKPPFEAVPRIYRDARWARPELVAEVEFTEFTADGMLRHPSFKGVRTDKAAREVRLEVPRKEPPPAAIEKHRPRFGKRRR